MTWAELWKAEPQQIKFLIQAVYDVLPSPSNLHIWSKVESPACPLCFRRGTLEHILSCCTKALGEGWYRWRHYQVLKAIVEGVEWAKHSRPSKQTFIRAGEQPRPAAKTSAGILATASDWQLLVDLEQQLKFPNRIVTTTFRPNVVLLSESTKQVVLLELTVPWEDRLEGPLKGSSPSTRDWSASDDKPDGEQGVSQSRSEAGALRPDPCAEHSVC